jgi:hypothetical protein
VVDLIARDGSPAGYPQIPQTSSLPGGEPSERKKGIRRGAKMVFFSLAMFLPVLAFAITVNEEGFLFLPLTLFVAGILWMIYYRLFGDEQAPAPKPIQPVYFGPPPQHSSPPILASLTPPQSAPVYRSPMEAPKEPHSVVEHTTRSLEKMEDRR